MPKGRPSKIGATDDESSSLQNMPIASALRSNDADVLAALLASSLPGSPDVVVSNVVITKSVGEAFTGGRSTPVYYITCDVHRPAWPEPRERRFVAKLVVMDGDAECDARLRTRRDSYAVERRFYDVAAGRIRDGGLEIPRLLASDRDGAKAYPAVCFLMNDVRQRGFALHPDFLTVDEAKRALRYIANFHSIFWKEGNAEPWRRDLWKRGGFWTEGKDCVDTKTISMQWSQTLKWMQANHPSSVSNDTKGLGKRMQDIARPLDKFLSMESLGEQGTLVHGDYKAANLFFTEAINSPDCGSEEMGCESVVAIDFQFAGGGLGAEDVAYLLFPDARGHFEDDQEVLLRAYHEELVLRLIERRKGGPSSIPFDTLRAHYELARIDFTRHLLGRGWTASTDGDALLVSALERTMNLIDGGKSLGGEKEYLDALSAFVQSG